jgi:hypothetical protein
MIFNSIRKIDKARDKGSLSAVFSNPACREPVERLGILASIRVYGKHTRYAPEHVF